MYILQDRTYSGNKDEKWRYLPGEEIICSLSVEKYCY